MVVGMPVRQHHRPQLVWANLRPDEPLVGGGASRVLWKKKQQAALPGMAKEDGGGSSRGHNGRVVPPTLAT
jgi:hypothetical protein